MQILFIFSCWDVMTESKTLGPAASVVTVEVFVSYAKACVPRGDGRESCKETCDSVVTGSAPGPSRCLGCSCRCVGLLMEVSSLTSLTVVSGCSSGLQLSS